MFAWFFFTIRQNNVYRISFLSVYTFLVNALAGRAGLKVEVSEKRVRGGERARLNCCLQAPCRVSTVAAEWAVKEPGTAGKTKPGSGMCNAVKQQAWRTAGRAYGGQESGGLEVVGWKCSVSRILRALELGIFIDSCSLICTCKK